MNPTALRSGISASVVASALALALTMTLNLALPQLAWAANPSCFARVFAFFTGKTLAREIPNLMRLDAKVQIRRLPPDIILARDADINTNIGDHVWVSRMADFKQAQKAGRAFEGARVEDLPRGRVYNYVILENGTPVYGMVENAAEYGVKHFQLAQRRTVKAYGELRIDPRGEYSFSAHSPGRPTQAAIREAQGEVRPNMAAYWRTLFKKEGAWIDGPSRIRRYDPSDAEILDLCRDPVFRAGQGAVCR